MQNRLYFVKIPFLLFLLFLTTPFAAQEKCDLQIKDAPSIFGLNLGMNPKQVQSVLGKNLKLKIKKEGTFFQNFIEKKPPSFLPQTRAVYLRFFEAKLYQIEVFYEPLNERRTLEEFIGGLSAKFNLPPNFWTIKYEKAALNCVKFSIVADNILNPRVELTDEILRARFEAAQKDKNK